MENVRGSDLSGVCTCNCILEEISPSELNSRGGYIASNNHEGEFHDEEDLQIWLNSNVRRCDSSRIVKNDKRNTTVSGLKI
jgi:hypothetical protein